MLNKWLSNFGITLANPGFLWLLLLVPIYFLIKYWINKNRKVVLKVSTTKRLAQLPTSWKVTFRPILDILRGIALFAFIIALARPQETNSFEDINNNGIDIVLSLDISTSMLAEDFKPNRLESSKKVATKFISDRPNDRIGLVIFSGESFTQCPITIDHNVLLQQLSGVESGLLQDGTSIGMGLATAVDRLRNATGKSRVVILMTDGVNNAGMIDPATALSLAKKYKVRVYTIGVGSQGEAMYPIPTPNGIVRQKLPVQIDEALLKDISKETGGKYFRATNNKSLDAIYKEIDQLEKTKIEVNAYRQYKDVFFKVALLGILALIVELILSYTLFKRVP